MKKYTRYFYNPISMVGFALVLLSFLLILFFLVIDFFFKNLSPYIGIVTFVILPAIMLLGMLIVPIGVLRERRRIKKHLDGLHALKLDFGDPHHRRLFMIFSILTVLIMGIMSVASYEAFEFTESVPFCGQLCHEVMNPEFVTYQNGAHARVACVECHVGSGADWYVRSKLSGMYQVYSVLANKYSKPIPTPIENLRPAQETCEHCHWPQNFYGDKVVDYKYYLKDEENTSGTITMKMKIGGGSPLSPHASGIHWHMNINNKITYIATDDKRQEIPWVKVERADGLVFVYQSEENPLDAKQLETLEPRRMDCMDCHNRPSHNYRSPAKVLNALLAAGKINNKVPEIRSQGSEVLIAEYSSKDQALKSIDSALFAYYNENYPEVVKDSSYQFKEAVKWIKQAYKDNFFPSMNADWRKYPEDIGHMQSPGCFRCHDGLHVNEKGETLSKDCNSCHTLLAQGAEAGIGKWNEAGLEFKHPVDIEEEWKETLCNECHSGE